MRTEAENAYGAVFASALSVEFERELAILGSRTLPSNEDVISSFENLLVLVRLHQGLSPSLAKKTERLFGKKVVQVMGSISQVMRRRLFGRIKQFLLVNLGEFDHLQLCVTRTLEIGELLPFVDFECMLAIG